MEKKQNTGRKTLAHMQIVCRRNHRKRGGGKSNLLRRVKEAGNCEWRKGGRISRRTKAIQGMTAYVGPQKKKEVPRRRGPKVQDLNIHHRGGGHSIAESHADN